LQFDFLVSFPTYKVPEGYLSDLTSWSWLGFLSYLQLNDGANSKNLQGKLDQFYQENTSANGPSYQFHIQSLEEIYLGSADLVDDLASNLQIGNRFTIYALGIVAILILLIASFNFMNLSIAVAVGRGKEIGLRKMLGADKGGLVAQLLTESVVLALISLTIAYMLSLFAFSYIRDVLEWNFLIDWTQVMFSLPFAVAATVLLGIVAGLYPALMLSGHKAVLALKSNVKNNLSAGSNLRKILIAFQFSISISLIAATIVITKQIQYLSDQELGFDRENVVVIKLPPQDMTRHYEAFKNRLLQNNHILSVSRGQRPMGDPWPVNMLLIDGRDPSESKQILSNQVGYDYLETMGIKLREGRAFSQAFADDPTGSIILSEKAVNYLNLDDPIGKKVWHLSPDGPRTIIGVVEDFNFLSLHHEISPMVLIMPFVDIKYLFIRLSPGDIGNKIAALQNIWEATVPGVPLDFRFMDDQLNELYQKEKKLSYLISGFSILAILLACLGLYGLVAFTVDQRRKEVGIRKVLGASISSLLIRFSRQYILLIGAASLIAIPTVQYILNRWLENFAYRIEISWWIYILSTVALIVVALFTISHQVLRAALVNPVNVLRDE
jgi:putative ABC transport system permease protein